MIEITNEHDLACNESAIISAATCSVISASAGSVVTSTRTAIISTATCSAIATAKVLSAAGIASTVIISFKILIPMFDIRRIAEF